MTEYNAMGLENYIYNFMKNLTPRKDKNGWDILEARYYKNITTDMLINKVHSKILDKLTDKISDKFIEDLLYEELEKKIRSEQVKIMESDLTRIEKLEKENEQLKCDLYNTNANLQHITIEYEKENEELKERLQIESQSLHEQCEIVSKQVEQIEKMKCCGNCSRSCFAQDCEDIVNRCDYATSDSLLFKCDKWELAT